MGRFVSRHKKIILLVFVGYVLLLAGGVILFFPEKEKVSEADTNYETCLSDQVGLQILNEFPQFQVAEVEAMADVTSNIEALPNVSGAIHCQYILARYDAFRGDLLGSIDHYQKVLEISETNGKWISPLVGVETKEDVSKQIASYKEVNDALLGQSNKNPVRFTFE